jgi:hypothetical protein
MELITFFVVIIIFMILDNFQIKKDIDASRKIKWTKKDAEQYYNETFKNK